MKIVLIAAVAALLSAQAFAQGGPGKPRPTGMNEVNKGAAEKEKQMKENEAAAKAAMSKIPDSKEKYDPWKIAR